MYTHIISSILRAGAPRSMGISQRFRVGDSHSADS